MIPSCFAWAVTATGVVSAMGLALALWQGVREAWWACEHEASRRRANPLAGAARRPVTGVRIERAWQVQEALEKRLESGRRL